MNQGGRGQRAGPLRSHPEVEPDGDSCGASGAAPQDGTVSPDSNRMRRPRRSTSLDGIRNRSAELTRRDGRTRWTEEENILLMRVHYIAEDLQQTSNRTYREILTTTWNDINPNKISYPNLLSNRVRWILQNAKFSSVELANIKRSYRPHTPTPTQDLTETEEVNRENQHEQNHQIKNTSKVFNRYLQLYSKISPQDRPGIPRLRGSRKIFESVERTNEVIRMHINNNSTLEDIVDFVYAGAITVCEENNIGRKTKKRETETQKDPPWKARLEKKINGIRKRIGTLHTYLNTTSPSRKVIKRALHIASVSNISREQLKDRLTVECDILKQKAKALGNRLRRYNERVKRYRNNNLFYKNPKQFYRTLETTTTTTTTTSEQKHPTKESIQSTWEEIWSRNEEHDDDAFWIREAEEESSGYIMEEENITEQDIKTVLKKTNNWSAPGPDGLHNYWWKYFTSTHTCLATVFQKALSKPSLIPDFCTLGVTHMIPKGTNSEDPKDYRPITCLPTISNGLITVRILS
ncbi:uncharacterized protein LOC123675420 [Harmonia axyridis]|uniref:uncharacterized protein LOC123675420 n=1 Tax=Harmonia axyridis TaxID=115357 RepID=UPI001E2759DD|nr:uncharacterized protein LOC123675420 [Harmonia axyridis]